MIINEANSMEPTKILLELISESRKVTIHTKLIYKNEFYFYALAEND